MKRAMIFVLLAVLLTASLPLALDWLGRDHELRVGFSLGPASFSTTVRIAHCFDHLASLRWHWSTL
jgi:hypothetical protein